MKLLEEVQLYKSLCPIPGAKVLDGGAHQGYATEIFLKDCLAREVIAVEPHPDNARIWRERIKDKRATLHEAALVANKPEYAPLFLGRGNLGSQMHSTVHAGLKKCILVRAVNFQELAKKVTHIKLDVEAAEYDLLHDPLPENVKGIAIELHVRRPEWRAQSSWVISSLLQQGFHWTMPPPTDLPRSRWGYVVIAHR